MSGGRRLGRYEVGERLGSGGLGEVYLAHVEGARGFRKPVVIKKIRSDLAARPETASLLRAEAEVVQRLAHGNIVRVLDFGVDDEAPYLVMEYVDGATLAELDADLCARGEQLGVTAGLFVVESVAAALGHAHAIGLVHRDVTPSNILVSRDGVVKLTDFGIASVIAGEGGVGTPGFAAPEQLAGEKVDERADVYALGVVLRAVLGGRGGDAALVDIAGRASATERAQRFGSVREFSAALERWRAGRGVLREAGGLAEAVQALQRRRGRTAGSVDAALGQRQRGVMTAVLVARPRRIRWRVMVASVGLVGCAAWWFAGVPGFGVDEAPRAEVVTAGDDEVPRAEVVKPAVNEAPRSGLGAAVNEAARAEVVKPASVEVVSPRPVRKDSKVVNGRLLVNLVPWAQVTIDDRAFGRTPVAVALAPGKYTLTLANPDLGQVRSREIAIAGGAELSITDW